jgi:hypothetical protein
MWASQLLIDTAMGKVTDNSPVLQFDFTGTPGYSGVDAVEVVMFSCPEWGTAVAEAPFLHLNQY